MEIVLSEILLRIRQQEEKLSFQTIPMIEEAYQMTLFLNETLKAIKAIVMQKGFPDEKQEIDFFKNIKPQVLGKLIFYNKVFRIESNCPVTAGELYQSYYEKLLKALKSDYSDNICKEDFYRYYRAGRCDKDDIYFRLGRVNYHDGLKSGVFEIDLSFSTYYDNKIAYIIANELLNTYILNKINPEINSAYPIKYGDLNKDISWTNSQNALIELIYALHASSSVSHGKIGIKKIALIFQIVFQTPLNDVHHSFHRMKTRAGSRTSFLDQLKSSLEEYMDKDL